MIAKDLSSQTIVITGASSGFGKGVARQLADRGAHLVLAARREHLLTKLAEECIERGGQAVAVPTDVSKSLDVEALYNAAILRFSRLDVWINDAGVGALGRFDKVPLADHVQVVSTNLIGAMHGSYFAMRQFYSQGHGTLINVASVVGHIPAPYYSSYTASKFGMVGLDLALRQELKENFAKEIHVCSVLPMAMDTPFFDHAANYTGHEAQPIPPLYEPQTVVDAICSLIDQPRDQVIVGSQGKFFDLAHRVAPHLTELMMAYQTHHVQFEDATPAAHCSGSVHRPQPNGTEVTADRLAR